MGVIHAVKGDIFNLIVSGAVTAGTFLDGLEHGLGDPAFKAPMRLLFDVRGAAEQAALDIEADRRGAYAEISHCFIPHWAIVAGSDITLFNMARLICTLTDLRGVDMRAYPDIEEARSQLTWNNFYQQDPFCRIRSVDCHPRFTREAEPS